MRYLWDQTHDGSADTIFISKFTDDKGQDGRSNTSRSGLVSINELPWGMSGLYNSRAIVTFSRCNPYRWE